MKTEDTVSEGLMAQRKALAAKIRARMAESATAAEEELWQEFKASIEKDRAGQRL